MTLEVVEDGVALGRDFAVHYQFRQPGLDPSDLPALREAQPLERGGRHRRSYLLVTGERAFLRGSSRLAHIVEESGQPQDEVRLGVLNGLQGVAVNVVRVIAALGDPLARRDLGQDDIEQAALVEKLDRSTR